MRKWVILDTEQIEMKYLVGFGLIFSRDDKKLGIIKNKNKNKKSSNPVFVDKMGDFRCKD